MCVRNINYKRKCVCNMKLKKLNNKVCGWLPYQTFVFPCDWDKCTKWFKAWSNSRVRNTLKIMDRRGLPSSKEIKYNIK